jgi:hypothetical protein
MRKFILPLFLVFAISSSAQISNDSLLAYYPFNGNVTDMSGNGYNGIASGVNYAANCEEEGNSALLLDGVNSYVDLSAFATTFRDHLDTMTIYFKIRFDKTTTNQTILSLGNLGDDLQTNVFEVEYENNQFQIETEAPNGTIIHYNNEYGVEIPSGPTPAFFDNNCHEIMITLLNDTLTYYRNEYEPTQTSTVNMFIGSHASTSSSPCCYFGGLLDELQFYNRIVDISELSSGVSVKNINKLEGILVYPNPNLGEVIVTSKREFKEAKIEIYDLLGQKIISENFSSMLKRKIILPKVKGVYSIRITNSKNETYSTQLIRK